ncbi:hypothetical protein [Psychrobacter sp. CAL346-MNA-CIBAN-0220]|uniref:hypothetical protein n=1 Tax=Psychrobacter sp. CAL346-MNA-CIBAN-0220 TaxID=3140457 RepID=UPI00331E473A
MVGYRWVVLGFMATIFMSTGCDKTLANNNNQVKEISIQKGEVVAKEVELQGKFKRSFEIYELEANGITYYVSDPDQLLIKYSNKINQNGYYKFFETCVVGNISSEGGYGPLSKYQNQITVSALCA